MSGHTNAVRSVRNPATCLETVCVCHDPGHARGWGYCAHCGCGWAEIRRLPSKAALLARCEALERALGELVREVEYLAEDGTLDSTDHPSMNRARALLAEGGRG